MIEFNLRQCIIDSIFAEIDVYEQEAANQTADKVFRNIELGRKLGVLNQFEADTIDRKFSNIVSLSNYIKSMQ